LIGERHRGSMRLATQPPNAESSRADRLLRQQRMVETAQPQADDQDHRRSRRTRQVDAVVIGHPSGTQKPPTPSTITMLACNASSSYARAIVSSSISTAACRAARWGATAGSKQ
jgi:hypothetical protein